MGWTWSHQPNLLLSRYPTLALIPEIVNRWPGLREEAERMKLEVAKAEAPPAKPK
jgi:hypothetical protein